MANRALINNMAKFLTPAKKRELTGVEKEEQKPQNVQSVIIRSLRNMIVMQ